MQHAQEANFPQLQLYHYRLTTLSSSSSNRGLLYKMVFQNMQGSKSTASKIVEARRGLEAQNFYFFFFFFFF